MPTLCSASVLPSAWHPPHKPQEAGYGGERAFIFEGNSPGVQAEATYAEALAEVNRVVSHALHALHAVLRSALLVQTCRCAFTAECRTPREHSAVSACGLRLAKHVRLGLQVARTCCFLLRPAQDSARLPSCLQANWLKAQGVRRGDYVAIYMPMILELPYAMVGACCDCPRAMHDSGLHHVLSLPAQVVAATSSEPAAPLPVVHLQLACARIGAVHAVVFGGFSAEALAGRIEGCKAKVCWELSLVGRLVLRSSAVQCRLRLGLIFGVLTSVAARRQALPDAGPSLLSCSKLHSIRLLWHRRRCSSRAPPPCGAPSPSTSRPLQMRAASMPGPRGTR